MRTSHKVCAFYLTYLQTDTSLCQVSSSFIFQPCQFRLRSTPSTCSWHVPPASPRVAVFPVGPVPEKKTAEGMGWRSWTSWTPNQTNQGPYQPTAFSSQQLIKLIMFLWAQPLGILFPHPPKWSVWWSRSSRSSSLGDIGRFGDWTLKRWASDVGRAGGYHLHHLGWQKKPMNFGIPTTSTGAGFLPTVAKKAKKSEKYQGIQPANTSPSHLL